MGIAGLFNTEYIIQIQSIYKVLTDPVGSKIILGLASVLSLPSKYKKLAWVLLLSDMASFVELRLIHNNMLPIIGPGGLGAGLILREEANQNWLEELPIGKK